MPLPTHKRMAYDDAVRQLGDVLREYDAIDVQLGQVVSGWLELAPDIRRTIGNLAPRLVSAVIAIEDRRRRAS